MNLYHIALNNLRRRRGKALFILLGLVIGVATLVSVYSVVEAMKAEMIRQAGEFGANVVITPAAGELTFSYGGVTLPEVMYDVERLSMDDVAALGEVPSREMIRVAAPRLFGTVVTDDGRSLLVAGAHVQAEFLIKPWLRLAGGRETQAEAGRGANPEGEGAGGKEKGYEMLDLTRQDPTGLDLADGEILLGAALAEALGIGEGGSLSLSGQEYRVRSLLVESGSAEDGQVLMNLKAAQDLLQRPGEVSLIDLSVDYTLGPEEVLLRELAQVLPRADIVSLRQEALRRDGMLTRMSRFGTALSLMIFLTGMLVVSLTMAGAVRDRTQEIAVFRALGFRKGHVTRIILLEGLFLSVLGGVLGFGVAVFAARFAGPYLAGMDIGVPWRLEVLALAVLLAVAAGLLSSLLPARQASSLDPAEALRFY